MYSDSESLKDELGVRRRVSIVWNYFEKLSKLRVRCRLCHHEQNYQGTTGNILRHLKNKHNVDCSQKAQKEQIFNQHSQPRLNNQESETNRTPSNEEELHVVKAESSAPSLHCDDDGNDIMDPYSEDFKTFEEYVNIDSSNKNATRYIEKGKPECKKNIPSENNEKSSILEERLKAEIDYFREKAGFYKMLKNRTALQAQKVKYELQHMS